jgi:hypothetical protein
MAAPRRTTPGGAAAPTAPAAVAAAAPSPGAVPLPTVAAPQGTPGVFGGITPALRRKIIVFSICLAAALLYVFEAQTHLLQSQLPASLITSDPPRRRPAALRRHAVGAAAAGGRRGAIEGFGGGAGAGGVSLTASSGSNNGSSGSNGTIDHAAALVGAMVAGWRLR